uniref:cytochrome P450 3A5-like n=1 Tax=Styela clava TaxID=7725 RepID=UPI00193A4B55|nr:cytochrome P450 3A5-like [Styela clava]
MMITPLDILSIESWILIASVILLIRYYLNQKWRYFEKLGIPYNPPSILKLGNILSAFDKDNAFEYDNQCKKKYGNIWGAFTGVSPSISVHDPDILRQIFIKEFQTFPDRQKRLTKVNGKEMNTGLTAVQGNQWKRIRNTMTPTFSTSKLKQMCGIIDWCAGNTVDALNRKIENNEGVFNSKEIFSRLSLDIVCSAAFSTKVHSQDDRVEEPEISKNAKKLFSGSILSPLIILFLIFPPLEKMFAKFNFSMMGGNGLNYFKKLATHVMNQRQENSHAHGRVDLMQLMLDAEVSEEKIKQGAEKGMTKTEIIGNSMLMILAGYENTGNTMSWTAYNLAQHPEIQVEVQEEIDEMMKVEGKFDYESVTKLKLLDMCINETLRLYMPILKNARYCEKEITINGLTIPEGIMISIPSYGLAHDPEYWDEPYKFKPERMRDMSQIDPMVYQPFGAGPRNCIGSRFALMEIKMSLAKLLHTFTFKPAEDTPKPPLKLMFSFSVRPKVDFDLVAVPRHTVAT